MSTQQEFNQYLLTEFPKKLLVLKEILKNEIILNTEKSLRIAFLFLNPYL